jgi:cyclopropane-fatty-acyl-phospholipid synthase
MSGLPSRPEAAETEPHAKFHAFGYHGGYGELGMNLVSSSLIQKRWKDAVARLEYGTLDFVSPDGDVRTIVGPKRGPRARFVIKDWEVLRRLTARGDIALGEDFIAGAWETDNLEKLIVLFLLNLHHFDDFANGNIINRVGFVLLNALVRRNSISGSKRNIRDHYDVGNDFYSLWLDKSMTYSSALYDGESKSLEQAQQSKYARILSKFTAPKLSVLEIGCGWGGFAERASAEQHRVTGLTISPAQHHFATERLKGAADIRLEDYRKSKGLYDMIVSIEMFEAVGEHYWPQYFSTIAERLKKGGRAMVQTIAIRDELFDGYRRRSDFIRHYVFPGGMLPSVKRFCEEAERAGLKVASIFSFGKDYARTLREWSGRMQEKRDDIMALGHDQKFLRNWEFYLGMCAAAFEVGRTDVVQVELVNA